MSSNESKPKDKLWMNKIVRDLMKKRSRLYNRYKQTGREKYDNMVPRMNQEVSIEISEAKDTYLPRTSLNYSKTVLESIQGDN